MVVSEEAVLMARDPSIKNSDDWPVYPLKKVKIVSESTGLPVSLFTAHQGHPIRVLGYLDRIDGDNAQNIRDPKYETRAIEISELRSYTFADFENGLYGFWVAGKAGWFELKDPAVSFRGIFDMMTEAASMFYFMTKKYRNAIAARWSLNSRTTPYHSSIFKAFLRSTKNRLPRKNIDDVRDGFHAHCEFLMASMLEGQEGLNWQQYPMLQYFRKQFPELYDSIKARVYPIVSLETAFEPIIESPILETAFYAEASSFKVTHKRVRAKRSGKGNGDQSQGPTKPGLVIKDIISISEDELFTEDATTQSSSHRRKSILQPMGNKHSKKATGRRKSLPRVAPALADGENGLDAEDDGTFLLENDAMLPGKAHETIILSSRTRAGQHVDSQPGPYQKKSNLPRRYLELTLEKHDLPSTGPQGPGDLWTCAFRGCDHREHEASTVEGLERIQSHFQFHADQAQELIDLANKESRPYLPVHNLLRRLAPESDPGFVKEMARRPSSVVRRY